MQWERIKARVKDIDGVAVTREVYVDRYWPRYSPAYYSPLWNSQLVGGGNVNGGIAQNTANAVNVARAGSSLVAENMTMLGKADYMDTKAA